MICYGSVQFDAWEFNEKRKKNRKCKNGRLLNCSWFAKDDAIWVLNYAFTWGICVCIIIMQNFNWLCLVFQSAIIVCSGCFFLSFSFLLSISVAICLQPNYCELMKSTEIVLHTLTERTNQISRWNEKDIECAACNVHNLTTNINKWAAGCTIAHIFFFFFFFFLIHIQHNWAYFDLAWYWFIHSVYALADILYQSYRYINS